MLKTLSLAGAALAMTATALVPITPAVAQSRHYGERGYDRGYDRGYRGDRGYRNERVYRGDRGYYNDRNYRARQKCNDGVGGTIVGAIAGGLLAARSTPAAIACSALCSAPAPVRLPAALSIVRIVPDTAAARRQCLSLA